MTNKRLLRARVLCLTGATLAGVLAAPPAGAQETRVETITAKQAEKAKETKPYTPSRFERVMAQLEETFSSPPSGFYPQFGTIPQGGGFSAGLGYRQFFGRQSVFDIRGAYSMKNYYQVEAAVRRPWHGTGRTFFETRVGYIDAPQVAFYGIGMDASTRTNFYLKFPYAAAQAEFRPSSWTRVNGEVGYDGYDTESGKGRHPSIETAFTPADTPGLFTRISYGRVQGSAAIDTRTSPSYSRKGSFLGAAIVSYSDTDGTYSFQRGDLEAIQHIPLLRENWVISLRGRVQTILDDGDTVPFFLLPSLGSGRTLRGYPTFRFHDRHSILTSAEFRWIPNRLAMDMALFYDAGKVTNRREDLDFENLESDWGIGVRFHAPSATVLRIEAARGSEGWRLVFATGAAW